MSSQTERDRRSEVRNIALWALQIVTAAAFLAAGYAKLCAQPMMVETFDKIGVGSWCRDLIGGIEIASAILLLIPPVAPLGALLLVGTMIGAVLTHLVEIGGSPVPAIVLGCSAAIVLWGRLGGMESAARRAAAGPDHSTSAAAGASAFRYPPTMPRVSDGRLPRPTCHVGHGNRFVRRLAVSPPGTGCGGSAAARWGAQESANQEHRAGVPGSGVAGLVLSSPLSVKLVPSAPSSLAPRSR